MAIGNAPIKEPLTDSVREGKNTKVSLRTTWSSWFNKVAIVLQIAPFGELPVYADNTAALAGGLTVGKVYQTVTGELRVVV